MSNASTYVANIDGAARGNPGPASYAVIVYDSKGRTIAKLGKSLGQATNNVAEYQALLAALAYAEASGIRNLLVKSDSELLVKQMQGVYKVRNYGLRVLFTQALLNSQRLDSFTLEYIPRESNLDADSLTNWVLDGHGDIWEVYTNAPKKDKVRCHD